MSSGMTAYICKNSKRFSDLDLEQNFYTIASELRTADQMVVDFRWVDWFDLWALIQLLFILRDEEHKDKRKVINVLSPEAVTPLSDEDKLARAQARIRFLSDMEFLDRAYDLGAEIWMQDGPSPKQVRRVEPLEVRQLADHGREWDSVAEGGNLIIPITDIKNLHLEAKRDEMFNRLDEVFGTFSTESIVQQAGLGDCLLSEIVMNVMHHAEKKGYVALRAVSGLRKTKRKSEEEYKKRLFARTHHALMDWQTYYNKFPDDAFFELVVVDRGPGITNTILEDEKLPDELRKQRDSIDRRHSLLQYSLRSDSTRLPKTERHKLGLTDFTGLAAVAFVLQRHRGSLLVRENKGRHIFGAATEAEGLGFGAFGPQEVPKFPLIRGTSISIVIPMRKVHYEPPRLLT